jgi:hypothetical protein
MSDTSRLIEHLIGQKVEGKTIQALVEMGRRGTLKKIISGEIEPEKGDDFVQL